MVAVSAMLAALAAVAATPASAAKPDPGVYKGMYEWDGMAAKMRIKVFESGTAGNWSLKCAGVERERFDINDKGRYQNEYAGGASGDLVKGKGKFDAKGTVQRRDHQDRHGRRRVRRAGRVHTRARRRVSPN